MGEMRAGEQVCRRCGMVLEGVDVCIGCLSSPPPWKGLSFWGGYKGILKEMIGRFKYRADFSLLSILQDFLFTAYCKLGLEVDMVVAVPLHQERLRRRGFNQALEIGKVFKKKAVAPIHSHALIRIRETPPQVGLPRRERLKNVRGAFIGREELVKGKRVLLVDDVYTTGATLRECTHVLLQAGARDVAVVVVARTLE